MDTKELRQKPKEELLKILQESRKRLIEMRFNLAKGQVKNVQEIQGTRKEIARILTLLKQETR